MIKGLKFIYTWNDTHIQLSGFATKYLIKKIPENMLSTKYFNSKITQRIKKQS